MHEAIASSYERPVSLIMVGGIQINGDRFLSSFSKIAKGVFPVFGCFTGADFNVGSTFVFTGNTLSDNGVLVLSFDSDHYALKGILTSGWMEVGTPKTISKSRGNVVYEIDGKPAFEVFQRYFQIAGDDGSYERIAEYPIQLIREDDSNVIRAPLTRNEAEGTILFGGDIPEKSRVRFCAPNISETVENTLRRLEEFKTAEGLDQPDAVIMFSCAIRRISFGSFIEHEVRAIQGLWKNTPLTGFFSFGEIGMDANNHCDLHNTTLSLVTLQERGSSPRPVDSSDPHGGPSLPKGRKENPEAKIQRLEKEKKILSNFLHRTSEDLDLAQEMIKQEQEKSERLLLNILPETIAERLKKTSGIIVDEYSGVSVLFADIVGFTTLSSTVSAREIAEMLNAVFSEFDNLAEKYGIEKIKTIGDAYMAAAGLPIPSEHHAEQAAAMALDMLNVIENYRQYKISVRIGIHSGKVVAGVIGKKKFIFDLWGDTVNTASRMESHGAAGRVHISEATYHLVKHKYRAEPRGVIDVKGKGEMATYFLVSS
jgi:class 3 adenylate cyclase